MKDNSKHCNTPDCPRPPRMAIKTFPGSAKTGAFSKVIFNDWDAPPSASFYCHQHGVATITSLAKTLVDLDDDEG